MFTFKPDYEQVKARIEAFWEGEIIDRPLAQFTTPRPYEEWVPEPISGHATPEDRWLDAEFQAELALARCNNTLFGRRSPHRLAQPRPRGVLGLLRVPVALWRLWHQLD